MNKKPWPNRRMIGIEKTLIRQVQDRAKPPCLNLGLGEPAFPTPKPLLDHVRQNIRLWNLGYTPNAGLSRLRGLVARTCGLKIADSQVCITVGAEEALFAALMVTVSDGDEVLIPDPGYPAYGAIVKMAGGIARSYPLGRENDFVIDPDRLRHALTPRTRAIIINSPHNPTGAVYPRPTLKALARVLASRRILAISDEVYREIYYAARPESLGRYYDRTLVVQSLSKTFSMTGWRLGWCYGPADLIRLIEIFHQFAVTSASAVSQHAALFALSGKADREKGLMLHELRRKRDLALTCLKKYTDIPFLKPEGAFYLFLDVSSKMARFGSSLKIALDLLEREKVVTIPGIAFGRHGEGYLRLSFAASAGQIEEGIRRIGCFFAKARN